VPVIPDGRRQDEPALPDLQCPASVVLPTHHSLCVGTEAVPPPIGSRLPLDRSRSGFQRSTSAEQYGRFSFQCFYRLEPYFVQFLNLRWSHRDIHDPGATSCEGRREGELFGGGYIFHSPTHFVSGTLNGDCFKASDHEATIRNLIRQVEPFAKSCSGSAIQQPTPVPPPPISTPVPPPPAGPPQCPGPGAPRIYDLWNPPPYPGLGGTVCRDGGGRMWINVSNNVYPVNGIQAGPKDPNNECWLETKVVTPGHTYGGTLCR
jgi:hypothetical protein